MVTRLRLAGIGAAVISVGLIAAYVIVGVAYRDRLRRWEPDPFATVLAGPTCTGGESSVLDELRKAWDNLSAKGVPGDLDPNMRIDPEPVQARANVQAARQLLAPYLARDVSLDSYDADLADLLTDIPLDGKALGRDDQRRSPLLARVSRLQQRPIDLCTAFYRDSGELTALQDAERSAGLICFGGGLWFFGLAVGALYVYKRNQQ